MIDETKLTNIRASLKEYPDNNPVTLASTIVLMAETMDILWKIVRAGQEHIRTHGHTSDVTLEDALIAAGLSDPALAEWRKGLKKPKK